MADTCAKLLKVLKIELEDLIEDIGLIEKRAAARFLRSEITDYVYRENDGLFRLEAIAIRQIINFIDGIDISLYKNCDELADALGIAVQDLLEKHEDPQAVYRFFQRKLAKVRTFIDSAE